MYKKVLKLKKKHKCKTGNEKEVTIFPHLAKQKRETTQKKNLHMKTNLWSKNIELVIHISTHRAFEKKRILIQPVSHTHILEACFQGPLLLKGRKIARFLYFADQTKKKKNLLRKKNKFVSRNVEKNAKKFPRCHLMKRTKKSKPRSPLFPKYLILRRKKRILFCFIPYLPLILKTLPKTSETVLPKSRNESSQSKSPPDKRASFTSRLVSKR